MSGFMREQTDVDASNQAFLLIALVVCLGGCLIAALHDMEEWRRRRRDRKDMVRAATRAVIVPERLQ